MYCCEKMVKILRCYLIPKKKVMAVCLRVQFFLANPVLFCHFANNYYRILNLVIITSQLLAFDLKRSSTQKNLKKHWDHCVRWFESQR